MNVRDERELVQAALRGDPAAFAALAAPARGRVIAVVARIVGADEAEDVVQEALLRAFLGLSRLREHGRFESWLCGVAINVAKMRLRSRASQARAIAAVALPLEVVAEEQDLLNVVRDAVEVLPPGQRDVVLMHYIDDLSCEEIAASSVRLREPSASVCTAREHSFAASSRRLSLSRSLCRQRSH